MLSESGFTVETAAHALDEKELAEKVKGFHALGIRSKTKVSESVLEQLPALQVIGAFCIGTNQIDLNFANKQGVSVFNAPYSNTRSVAELVLCEIIALSRKLGDVNRSTHRGQWNKSSRSVHEVRGKTLGIVGYGHIGSQVSVLAEACGLKVIYFDVVKKLPIGNAKSVHTLDELLEVSDFVTLHVPATPQTENLLGNIQLKKMKKGGYLINASRGNVVDIEALVEQLQSGHLAGAAVDVFPHEPSSREEIFQSPLQEMENVILTPHIGGSTEEAQVAIGVEVAQSLIRYLQMGVSLGAVNFPQISIPTIEGEDLCRIVNVHRNVPGVLGEINSIANQAGANIQSQHLSTNSETGYMAMDIEKGLAEGVAGEISVLETSLKTRVLSL